MEHRTGIRIPSRICRDQKGNKKEEKMKKILLALAIILIIPTIAGQTETKDNLNLNSTATVWGKTMTILKMSDAFIKVEVDGKEGMIDIASQGVGNESSYTEINGMAIRLKEYTYIDETYARISVEITVETQCGDGICDKNVTENNETCCTDCGCSKGECIGNICKILECKNDTDCDDKNNCTINTCGNTGKCTYTPWVICQNGDGCCPAGCKYDNDTDCQKEPEPVTLDICKNNTDCNDNNACTKDLCEGNPKNCTHSLTEGCNMGGKCLNITQRAEKMYCTAEGSKKQKENKEACNNSYECLEDSCINNLCGKESKKGLYIGIAVAVLTFLALIFMGYSIFKKKEQNLNPEQNSEGT
jgi:hypothetical protein